MKTVNGLSRSALLSWTWSLLPILLVLNVSPAATAAQYLDFTYKTDGAQVTITKYTGRFPLVTVPSSLAGSPVTVIGDLAFDGCASLVQVAIPSSVTTIGKSAFQNCAKLASVTIPDSVISLGDSAFNYCVGLTNVTIGSGVTQVAGRTFAYCAKLTTATLGNNVTSIGTATFQHCDTLANVTIPNGVTNIGDSAFAYCASLAAIDLPNNLTRIEKNVFLNCTGLTSLTIPGSVTSIGSAAFRWCVNLKSLYFEGNAPDASASIFFSDGVAIPVIVYYRTGTTGWQSIFATFAGRPARPGLPPVVNDSLGLGAVLEGSAVTLKSQISGSPVPSYQWFHDGEPIAGATNEVFLISPASDRDEGAYLIIASNVFGTVTNGPATLGVYNVVPAHFFGLVLTDPLGTALQLQSAADIQGPWTPLVDLVLANTPDVFIDFTATNAGQRFYRTTQPNRLQAGRFPGWTFTAPVGSQYQIEYVDAQAGFTNWQFLTNLTLPSSPYEFIDTTATNQLQRLYRTNALAGPN